MERSAVKLSGFLHILRGTGIPFIEGEVELEVKMKGPLANYRTEQNSACFGPSPSGACVVRCSLGSPVLITILHGVQCPCEMEDIKG